MYSTIVLTNRGTSWPGWPLCCTSSKGIPNTLAVLRDSFRVRERLFLIASTATLLQSLCMSKTYAKHSQVHVTKTTTKMKQVGAEKGPLPKQELLSPSDFRKRSRVTQTRWQGYVKWSGKLQTWYAGHTDGNRWLSCKATHHIIFLSIRIKYHIKHIPECSNSLELFLICVFF